jgi:glutamate-1-semialdehyde 2,1-aminomutase
MPDRAYGVNPSEVYSRSLELQSKAVEEIPEVASSNHRGKGEYAPYPLIYMQQGEGATLTDVDGNEYVDFHCGVSALITGHRPERQMEAVREQLDRGPYFATTYELEYETAKTINDMLPASDRTKFISTGTEAIMTAARLARAYTGKEKVLKFEGMYHGHSDDMLVNVHPHPGSLGERRNPNKIPESVGVPGMKMDAVESVPWNDVERLREKLEREGDEIAAIVTEAVASNSGLIWPQDGYLKEVERLAAKHDALFILDEVVTGFRMGLEGAQGYFDLEPDLAIYGKAIANGFPCAALTGKAEIMDFINADPTGGTFMGTFSGNPLVVSATKANLDILQDIGQEGYDELYQRGERLTAGIEEILTDAGFDVFVPDFAGFFFVHFHDGETDPTTWTEYRHLATRTDDQLFEQLAANLIDEGVFIPPQQGRINMMHVHDDSHVDMMLEATKRAVEDLQPTS